MPKKTHDVTWSPTQPITVKPERAAECIKLYQEAVKKDPSKRNRAISMRRVREYAAAMQAGKWTVNGESIKFDEDGILIDGQHRMMACAMSETPLVTMIVYNVPRTTFDTIDVGNIRTATQVMTMSGVRYGSNVTAIINGLYKFMESMPDGSVYAAKERCKPYEVRATYLSDPEMYEEAAEFGSRYNRTGVVTQKMLGTLYYYLIRNLKQDKDLVSEFLINITLDDSVPNPMENALRKKLFALKGLPYKYDRVRLNMIAKTWNALAEGQSKLVLPGVSSTGSINMNPIVPQFESRNK